MQRYEIISDYRLYTPDYFAEAEEIKSKIDIHQLYFHFHPHLYYYFTCFVPYLFLLSDIALIFSNGKQFLDKSFAVLKSLHTIISICSH